MISFASKSKKESEKNSSQLFGSLKKEIPSDVSREYFFNFINSILDGVAVLDFKGSILFFNDSAAKILEIKKPKKWIGKKIIEFLPDEMRATVIKDMIKVKFGKGGYLRTYKMKTAKGREIYIENIGTKITFFNHSVILISFRDITSRVQNEKSLEDEIARSNFLRDIILSINKFDDLNLLLDNILNLILKFFNFDGGGIYLLDKSKKIATVAVYKNLPKKFIEQINNLDIRQKPYDQIFVKGKPIITENYANIHRERAKNFNFKSLASIPLVAGTEIIGALNITSKKRSFFTDSEKQLLLSIGNQLGGAIKRTWSEIELKQSKERYKMILDNSLDIIYSIDATGKILFISPNVSIWGYKMTEVLGRNMNDFVHPEDIKMVQKSLKKSLFENKPFYTTFRLLKKDGTAIYAEEFGRALLTEKGGLMMFSGVIRDVSERHTFIEQLKNYNNRLRIIFENAPEPYYLSDMKGILTDGNLAAQKLLGYKKEELIGNSFLKMKNLIAPGQVLKVISLLRRNKRGESTGPDEFILLKKNGEPITVEISTHPVVIDHKKLVLGIARDVSKRKQAEIALKYERDRNALYLNIVGVMIVIIGADGKVISINRKACEILGYSEDKIIGKDWFDNFIPKKARKDVEGVFRQILAGKKEMPGFHENAILTASGKERVIAWNNTVIRDVEGKISASLSSGEDITERKKSEEILARHVQDLEKTKNTLSVALDEVKHEKIISENLASDLKKFKLAVDNASDHIIITDISSNIVYANGAAERITGYKISEMIGNTPGKLWGGQMKKEYFKQMWQVIKTEKKIFKGELVNKRKNGELYDAEVRISPIKDKKNNVLFFVGIERDITEAKNIDRAKTEFISIASHQLRTPLTGIKWFAELLLFDEAQLTEKHYDYIKKIYNSNQKMLNLVKDLLDVSHIESGKKFSIQKKNINLAIIINRAISDHLQASKLKRVSIDKIRIAKSLPIFADGDKIYQVLQNLLTNAIKYSKIGSKIEVGAQKNKNSYLVFVRDYGLGIPVASREKIFEKFYRAKNVVEGGSAGTGLGLYIAKSIIEAHGGKMWFESTENKETTFYFELPKKQ